MISRIIMDRSVEADGKVYLKGQVYDSRFRMDMPAAEDGVQHAITEFLVGYFIAKEWAHEQTWDEWFATIEERRKAKEAA